jgi:hypothetical protein|uniref:DUF3850 domain-containing protein n=1 Tax=Siphoviridae sp. ctQtc11 TaxID=2825497 RepID=A0A8S5P5J7_9CAUD|nr:MAG TPA: protein of unknown function (DUF3850) [Siphoviridae sp. ctQtc11]
MIKRIKIFYPLFEQIQRGRNNLNICVKEYEKEFKKGDILMLNEIEYTRKEDKPTGCFMHVEVVEIIGIHEDEYQNRIYIMNIKPRLDMRIALQSLKGV